MGGSHRNIGRKDCNQQYFKQTERIHRHIHSYVLEKLIMPFYHLVHTCGELLMFQNIFDERTVDSDPTSTQLCSLAGDPVIDFDPDIDLKMSENKRPAEDARALKRKRGRNVKFEETGTKGIYETSKGFRVQLSMRPVLDSMALLHRRTPNGSVKFSRNCKRYDDALWLYEVIFLISDQPHFLEELIVCGNYGELRRLFWPTSTDGHREYYCTLGNKITELRNGDVLTDEEYSSALIAYQSIRPPNIINSSSSTSTSSSTGTAGAAVAAEGSAGTTIITDRNSI